jgi:hypothetical protein
MSRTNALKHRNYWLPITETDSDLWIAAVDATCTLANWRVEAGPLE